MDNHLLEILKNTTEYVETNLLEELNLDDISSHVNISKFHLLRIWKGATATGLMEYVRRRRITSSLSDLIHSEHSMDYIASKYSFGSDRAYNRVFKDEYGITPAKWRKNPTQLDILDRFNTNFINCAGESLIYFRAIVAQPHFSIAGPEYKVDIQDNRDNQTSNKLGLDFFHNYRTKIINPVEKNIYIGYTAIPVPAQSYTYYQPAIQIDNNSIVTSDMKIRHVKPHKYGVFTYIGPHPADEISSKTLADIWQFIYDTWMPTVQFDLQEVFHYEHIDLSKCSKQYCECDLYYPISTL